MRDGTHSNGLGFREYWAPTLLMRTSEKHPQHLNPFPNLAANLFDSGLLCLMVFFKLQSFCLNTCFTVFGKRFLEAAPDSDSIGKCGFIFPIGFRMQKKNINFSNDLVKTGPL